MSQRPYNLAIETSGRGGSIALGCGDQLLATEMLIARRRHNVGLMPTVAALCRTHGIQPTQLGELYVSMGPGSFTGLRVAITTAKMLALSLGVRLVGVPTLEVLAANAPADVDTAVCLNTKRQNMYCAVYRRDADGSVSMRVEASLRTVEELLAAAPPPLAIIAEKLPDVPLPADVTVLPASYAVARGDALWRLGRARARADALSTPTDLLPLYIREPEAVTLWNQRHATEATSQS